MRCLMPRQHKSDGRLAAMEPDAGLDMARDGQRGPRPARIESRRPHDRRRYDSPPGRVAGGQNFTA